MLKIHGFVHKRLKSAEQCVWRRPKTFLYFLMQWQHDGPDRYNPFLDFLCSDFYVVKKKNISLCVLGLMLWESVPLHD